MKHQKQLPGGILLVVLGAASYGVLATMVGLAHHQGYSTTELVLSQYLIGLLVLGGMTLRNRLRKRESFQHTPPRLALKLIGAGTTLGLVGYFYYCSVQYIPVSIAVVLLMQSIWISVLLDALLDRKMPGALQIIAIMVVLMGTALATNAIQNLNQLHTKGLFFGLLAGTLYALMLTAMNRLGGKVPPAQKSFLMLIGATAVVVLVGLFNWPEVFQWAVFWKWGFWLALFGTILPPLLFSKGIPRTGMGLGAVLIAIEIPVSILSAYLFLSEKVLAVQWLGVGLILFAVVLIHSKSLRNTR